jgi:hypothetical protein
MGGALEGTGGVFSLANGIITYGAFKLVDNYTKIISNTTGLEYAAWKYVPATQTINFGSTDGAGTFKDYFWFDCIAHEIRVYINGNDRFYFNNAFMYYANDNIGDNGYSGRRWRNGFFGTQVGIHDGTRWRGFIDASGQFIIIDSAGNAILTIDINGSYLYNKIDIVQETGHTLVNKSGGNTVLGLAYDGVGAADYSVGALVPNNGTHALNPNVMICTGAGGIPDGSTDKFSGLVEGELMDLFLTGAATRGHYVIFTVAGGAGKFDDSAAVVAGKMVGVVEKATGGSGLARVRIHKG